MPASKGSGVRGEVNSIGVGVVSNINLGKSVSGKLNSVGQSVLGVVTQYKALDNEHS